MKKILKEKYVWLIMGVATLIVAMYSTINPFFHNTLTTDQAVFFTIAKGILNGKLAYVDFFDHKGPLLYFILAFGLMLGQGTVGNFVIELFVIFISMALLYKTARLYTEKPFALLGVLLIFFSDIRLFTSSNSEEYIFPLLVGSVYLLFWQIKNGNSYARTFIIGVCGMFVFFIKFNYCLIWVGLAAVYFIVMLSIKTDLQVKLKTIGAFLAGLVIGAIPFLIYLFATNSFKAFIDSYVLYSYYYAGYTAAGDRIACVQFLLNNTLVIFILISILYLLFLMIKKPENEPITALSLFLWLLIAAGIIIVTASPGTSWGYYKQATMGIYILPIALSLQWVYALLKKKWHSVLGFVAVVLFCGIGMRGKLNVDSFRITPDLRGESARKISELINEETDENDTMISYSNDCTMYFYSDCSEASRIIFPSAAIVDDALQKELMTDLKEKEPKIVTMQSDWKAGLSEEMILETENYIYENYDKYYVDEYRVVYKRK